MKIGKQSAFQINNIETLNGNFKISDNTFSFSQEFSRTEEDIILILEEIKNLLIKKGFSIDNQLLISETELKENIAKK